MYDIFTKIIFQKEVL